MLSQRYLLLSDVHGNIDGIKRLLHARYHERKKFDAIIITGDFPVTTPVMLVLIYMTKNHNLSRLGYSTKVYKEELRSLFIKYQISSLTAMMNYLKKFQLPILYIPGNVETRESINHLEQNYSNIIFLDNNHYLFQDKINFFGIGGSLDHHGIVCDHEYPSTYFRQKSQELEQKILKLENNDPKIFLFHEPPYFNLDQKDLVKMITKAKKRGYEYTFELKAGSEDFHNLIKKYSPNLVLNGHFHEYQGIKESNNTLIINPGAMVTYNYGILSINLQKSLDYRMNFFRIRPSIFNFSNFLYQKRNFIENNVKLHN